MMRPPIHPDFQPSISQDYGFDLRAVHPRLGRPLPAALRETLRLMQGFCSDEIVAQWQEEPELRPLLVLHLLSWHGEAFAALGDETTAIFFWVLEVTHQLQQVRHPHDACPYQTLWQRPH